MNKTDHSIPTDKTTGKQYRNRLPLLPLACFLLILLLFSGCAGKNRGLQPAEPPLVLPEAFTQSGSQILEPYWGHEYWWHEFGDDNLRHLIDTALESNPNLKIYGERLIQAQALARKAGADLLPSLNGQAAAARSRAHTNQGTATSTDLLLGLAASYEIDLWGRLQAVEDASILDARASAEDLQAASLSLAAQVANLWYQLAESYAQEAVLKQQQEVNRTALELVRLRFNAGQIGIADLLQQKQLIESKNGELARQRATSKVLEHQLSILAGTAPGTFILPAKPDLIALPSLPATGVPADLLANRPDIRSQYLALLAADRRVAAAVADQYPQLSLSAGLSTSGASTHDLFDNWLSSLAANILAPLFDGGLRQAEAMRTKAFARERFHAYGQSLLTAVGEVEDALVQEKEQRLFLDSLQIQLKLATSSVERLKDRYKKGTTDYQRILDALLSQQSLQQNIITEKRRLIGYRIDLYRALGGKAPVVIRTDQPPLPNSLAHLRE